MVISLLADIKIINFIMVKIISLILIVSIIIFLFFYKRNNIFIKKNSSNILNHDISKNIKKNNSKKFNLNQKSYYQSNLGIFSKFEKLNLRKEMFELFRGSKEQKLKALKIAKHLSDQSSLRIIRLGLKDMDSDIVQKSDELIQEFK